MSTMIINQNQDQDTRICKILAENKGSYKMEDGNEESYKEKDTVEGSSMFKYQTELDENKDNEQQRGIQNRTTESRNQEDIGEFENNLLFSSPKDRMEKATSRTEAQETQQLNFNKIPKEELTLQWLEGDRKTSKFWQTPDGLPSSPFTPMETQSKSLIEGRNSEVSIAKDFQHFLNEDSNSTPEIGISKFEVNNLEQLSKELIQVFNFDDLDNSTISQKEELIQRVIKLGGDDYTAEDLQMVIIAIQLEDSEMKKLKQSGIKTKDKQEGDRKISGEATAVENKEFEEDNIGNQIYKELELEESDKTEEGFTLTEQEQGIYQQELGIQMNQEGLTHPNYGKPKGERARRSLKELCETEGLAREQKKIDELFEIGKGKCLPKTV